MTSPKEQNPVITKPEELLAPGIQADHEDGGEYSKNLENHPQEAMVRDDDDDDDEFEDFDNEDDFIH